MDRSRVYRLYQFNNYHLLNTWLIITQCHIGIYVARVSHYHLKYNRVPIIFSKACYSDGVKYTLEMGVTTNYRH